SLLSALFDFGDDRKTVVCWGLGEDRPVSSLLELEISFLGDRHRGGFRPVFLFRRGASHDCSFLFLVLTSPRVQAALDASRCCHLFSGIGRGNRSQQSDLRAARVCGQKRIAPENWSE